MEMPGENQNIKLQIADKMILLTPAAQSTRLLKLIPGMNFLIIRI